MKKNLFNELSFSQPLHQAIVEMGFVEATHIQSETIPLLLEGKDVIGQAHTGTGKTAAFGIPLLEKIENHDTTLSSVVLCPTRELALQVANELKKIAKHKKHIHVVPVYGGESIQHQIKELKRHVQIIVGTPGRIIDHLDRGTLSFDNVKTVVLDEADEMLNMGFRDDIETILKTMPKERQTVLFSATMPKPIIELAKKYQHRPVHVKVTKENLTASSIEQAFFDIDSKSKIPLISSLIAINDIKLSVVFCNTKRKVDEVTKSLKSIGLKAEGIHGDLDQRQRNKVLGGFRTNDTHILVATDVAARGIDVSNIDAVFNYDIPLDPEYYVHRIGRTGRAGKTGKAFSFVTGRNEFRLLKNIERFAGVKIERKPVPTDKEERELKLQKLFTKVRAIVTGEDISRFEEMTEQFTSDGLTSRQLAAALLKIVLPEEKKSLPVETKDHSHRGHHRGHNEVERKHSHRERRHEDRQRDDSHAHRTEHRIREKYERNDHHRIEERRDSHPTTRRFVKRKIKQVVGY